MPDEIIGNPSIADSPPVPPVVIPPPVPPIVPPPIVLPISKPVANPVLSSLIVPTQSGTVTSIPNPPTIVFPNGGEDILTRTIQISWLEPRNPSPDGAASWYEVLYSENYDYAADPDWIAIATSVPIGVHFFEWNIGNSIRSSNVRIGIRTVNIRGERSEMSISSASFKIRRAGPLPPALLSPVPNGRYGNNVNIIFDDSAVMGTFGQRAKYYVYFRSVKANIPYTSVAQHIPVGTGPIQWDTSLLPPSDDYEVICYLSDNDGNKSEEVNVDHISIFNEGFFIIDTTPPSGFVQINGNDFTRFRDISVKVFAHDISTGINAMQFIEVLQDVLPPQPNINGPADTYSNLKYWKISSGDGVKIIEALFQDYGANRTDNVTQSFRSMFGVDNSELADIVLQKGDVEILWVGVNGSTPAIYNFQPNGAFIANVNEPINALAIFHDTLYISVKTSDNTALVYRNTGLSVLEQIIHINSFESEVISMQEYKGNFYMGAMNGILYRYDGNAVSIVRTFDWPIETLYTDFSLLYILFRNSTTLFIFDGSNFTEVSL